MAIMDAKDAAVLHIEDDATLRCAVQALLELEGHQVVAVADGEAALEAVRRARFRPEVLIVDHLLPGEIDGCEAAELVCRSIGYPVPTIILSAELPNAAIPWLPGVPLLPLAKPVAPQLLLKAIELFVAFQRFARTPERAAAKQPLPQRLQ